MDERTQGQFEGTVLTSLKAIEDKLDVFAAGQADHETRMRSLEADVQKARGATAMLSALVGAVASMVGAGVALLVDKLMGKG